MAVGAVGGAGVFPGRSSCMPPPPVSGSRTSPGTNISSPSAAPCSSIRCCLCSRRSRPPIGISRFRSTILDHGAIFGLLALLALVGLAWHFRRRLPLASFGFFAYLLLMAPTSSILPIHDPVAERRLYLSMLGPAADRGRSVGTRCSSGASTRGCLRRGRGDSGRCDVYPRAGLVERSGVMGRHGAEIAPQSPRAFSARKRALQPGAAATWRSPSIRKSRTCNAPDYNLLVDWALAYDCLNQPDVALAKLRQAAALEPTAHVYSQIGMIYGKRAQWAEAMEALGRPKSWIRISQSPTFTRVWCTLPPIIPGRRSQTISRRWRSIPTSSRPGRGLPRPRRGCWPNTDMRPLRIGINALYLIPGGVGGTEIYLRGLLAALAEIDPVNRYFVFTNRETGPDLAPQAVNFKLVPQAVRAVSRPRRILWEQTVLPLQVRRLQSGRALQPRLHRAAVLPVPASNGVSRPAAQAASRVFPLVRSALLAVFSVLVGARFAPGAGGFRRHRRRFAEVLPAARTKYALCRWAWTRLFWRWPRAAGPSLFCWRSPPCIRIRTWMACCAPSPYSAATHPDFRLVVCGMHGFYTGPAARPARVAGAGGRSGFSRLDAARRICTICTRAPGPSSILRFSKASDCRCWKPWRPAFRRPVPPSSRWRVCRRCGRAVRSP